MEEPHYDEFGNYIGPALSDSEQVCACVRRCWWRLQPCSCCMTLTPYLLLDPFLISSILSLIPI